MSLKTFKKQTASKMQFNVKKPLEINFMYTSFLLLLPISKDIMWESRAMINKRWFANVTARINKQLLQHLTFTHWLKSQFSFLQFIRQNRTIYRIKTLNLSWNHYKSLQIVFILIIVTMTYYYMQYFVYSYICYPRQYYCRFKTNCHSFYFLSVIC